jgi:hypothetical protein
MGLALLASLISIQLGILVTLIEILLGVIVGEETNSIRADPPDDWRGIPVRRDSEVPVPGRSGRGPL